MDVDESMEGVDEEVESMMAELGVPPEEPEKPEHVATAYLRTQLEVGLTPEQVVGAAALVRALADNRRLLMQAGDEKTGKVAMLFMDGQWRGNDLNRCEPANPPTFKYSSGAFPMPDTSLRMIGPRDMCSTLRQDDVFCHPQSLSSHVFCDSE